MQFTATLEAALDEWGRLGCRALTTNVRQVGHVPHVAPEGYLFTIFPGLSDSDIDSVENDLAIPFHESLRSFYRVFNGLSLYSDSLSIYGMRSSYVREGEASIQPYSIATSNGPERIAGISREDVVIGFYNYDGSKVIMRRTGELTRTPRKGFVPLETWRSLDEFLCLELTRLRQLFDEEGAQDFSVSTTPSVT